MRRKARQGRDRVQRTFRHRFLKGGVGLAALFVIGLMASGALGDVAPFSLSTSNSTPSATDTTGASSSASLSSTTATDTTASASTATDTTASASTATDTTPSASTA